MAVLSRFRAFLRMYPVTRGMITYSMIWPTSCLIQQTVIEGKNYKNYNYWAAARFSIYGGLFVAPTLYCWIRLSTFIWPKTSLRTAVAKAIVEQMSYGPAALCMFFFGMTLLEGRGFHQATHEVSEKFWPSYKVAVCVWPILQTINFAYIKERNRVPFVSMCSLMWTSFLAYMHHIKSQDLAKQQQTLAAAAASTTAIPTVPTVPIANPIKPERQPTPQSQIQSDLTKKH